MIFAVCLIGSAGTLRKEIIFLFIQVTEKRISKGDFVEVGLDKLFHET